MFGLVRPKTLEELLENMRRKYSYEVFLEDYVADLAYLPNTTAEYELSAPYTKYHVYVFRKPSCVAIGLASPDSPYKPYDWYLFTDGTASGWKCLADIIGKIMVSWIHTNRLFRVV